VEHTKIETHPPKDLPLFKNRKQELVRSLAELTVVYLRDVYKFLFGKPSLAKKAELINEIAEALNFSSEEKFRKWFFSFPVITQRVLYLAAFTDYAPIPFMEMEFGQSLLVKNKQFSWKIVWVFNPDFRLDYLPVYNNYSCPVTVIPAFLRAVLCLWLVPPELSNLSACRFSEPPALAGEPAKTNAAPTAPWNNSFVIADAFPLLCDALQNILHDINEADRARITRNGFKKKDINELRTSTGGFLPFNPGGEFTPDSVDLAARFILCMYNYKPRRPNDGQEGIRNLAQTFFCKESPRSQKYYSMDRAYLEYGICIDHLSRTSGYYLDRDEELPASRKIFHDILLYIAADGNWFDADKLAEHIRITGKDFSFCDRYMEKSLKVKADTFAIYPIDSNEGPINLHCDYYDEFHPDGIMRFYLLARPLFKAYCYIFATLGILEIVQGAAPLVRSYRKKQYPFSSYDSLKAVRVTEFGRWCLDVTDKRPPKPPHEYHAIADRELFLVTVQGNSLERRLYLDKIGQRLGEDRWRISPASFIAGCANIRHLTERIERFKALIDPKPAPHWERLFQKVLDRAGIFDAHRSDMLVYDLPQNQELLEELLQNTELKHIARRVEGRMLAVAAKDQRKFYALLNEHGIAHF
jgi:hypothetical protein